MMKRLIVCVFGVWAPGQSVTALYVANRESHYYPWAQNPSSLCSGMFQHNLSAWPGRAHLFLWRGWFGRWPVSWADPRANAIVAARMVNGDFDYPPGWAPWGM